MGPYYYLDGAEPVGPFSLQDIYTLMDRNVVGPMTMGCREGGADWQLLLSLPEFTGTANASAVLRVPSASTESRRRRKPELNWTAIIIAGLLSIVAIYVTYAITHADQESEAAQAQAMAPAPQEPAQPPEN